VGFPGAVVDEGRNCSWVSPPPAKPGIEDKPGQGQRRPGWRDRSDPALRAQHRVIQLGARTGLPTARTNMQQRVAAVQMMPRRLGRGLYRAMSTTVLCTARYTARR